MKTCLLLTLMLTGLLTVPRLHRICRRISVSPLKNQLNAVFGKPLSLEKKFQLQLSNRFDGLEEVISKVKSPPEFSYETQRKKLVWRKLRRRGIVKWLDPTIMPYGFITMDNNIGFFHVKNVHGGVDYIPKPGDEISFFYDEYEKGAMDVKVLPTLSNFPSTPDIPTQMEFHPSDDSWETDSCEAPTTSKINNDIEDKKRDVGTVFGFMKGIVPDSDPSKPLFFKQTDLHREFGLKRGDRVSYLFLPGSDLGSGDVSTFSIQLSPISKNNHKLKCSWRHS